MHAFAFSNKCRQNFPESDMDLDVDVYNNFTDATFQLMGDDDLTPWRGP